MKKQYVAPDLLVVCFQSRDIITVSKGDELPDEIPDELSLDDELPDAFPDD